MTLNIKKDKPRTPLPTTITRLKNSNNGLKEKLRRVRSTEKKISSKINREVRILFLSIANKNTPRVMKTKLRLRNNVIHKQFPVAYTDSFIPVYPHSNQHKILT